MKSVDIDYSIIIPHKNIPELLQRCLNSIPQRSDIQIIIVDDDSSSEIVDFENFPGLDRDGVEILFTKEGKGAGYARNCGLQRAKGNWIIFADADDFFNPCFMSAVDEYRNTDYDIVFFESNTVDSDTLEILSKRLNLSNGVGAEERLRYRHFVPWGKMISRCLIETNSISFDETMVSNDVMFSVKAGYYASKITACYREVYCATVRQNSLWHAMAYDSLLVRIDVACRYNYFLRQKHLPQSFREYSYAYVKRAQKYGKAAYLKAMGHYLRREYIVYVWLDAIRLLKAKLKKLLSERSMPFLYV